MKYLYRGIRKEEIDDSNTREISVTLNPKSQEPFRSAPLFGTPDMNFPIVFEREINEIRHHQWPSESPISGAITTPHYEGSQFYAPRLQTSGVSTTPHIERAKVYAKQNVIVKIDRQLLNKFNIIEYVVADYLKHEEITTPEDDEIILVKEEKGPFPKEIINEIIIVKEEKGHSQKKL